MATLHCDHGDSRDVRCGMAEPLSFEDGYAEVEDEAVAAGIVARHTHIHHASTPDEATDNDLDDSDAGAWLTSFEGVGSAKADDLEDAGYAERKRVEEATVEDLAAVDGISFGLAESIKQQLA